MPAPTGKNEELLKFLAMNRDGAAPSVLARIDELNSQERANLAWAFATTAHASPELFNALAQASVRRKDELNSQEIANMAWAFSTVIYFDASQFAAFTRAAERRLSK